MDLVAPGPENRSTSSQDPRQFVRVEADIAVLHQSPETVHEADNSPAVVTDSRLADRPNGRVEAGGVASRSEDANALCHVLPELTWVVHTTAGPWSESAYSQGYGILGLSAANRVNSEVTVAVYTVRSDGDIALARLAADGIVARLSADDEGGLNPGFYAHYGVRLLVRPKDADDAYQSLAIDRVVVPFEVADAMFKHSGWAYPHEACGLVAFDSAGGPVLTLCLTNTDHARDRFTIAPQELFGALQFSERMGYSIGAVFHSHTESEAFPSESDIGGGADAEWLHFIVGPVAGRLPLLRAYRIVEGDVAEVKVTIGQ